MPEIKNLSKSFGEKTVLEHFSLSFEEGEHIGIMGSSGRGKTTLLRLICGLEKPDEGTILWGKQPRFSMVFQEDRLLEHMNAEENVALFCPCSRGEIREELGRLGIVELQEPVRTFSGGMKRRVALCRALLAPSDCVLLDEPYKGLDEGTKKTAMAECERLLKGKTVFLVTHEEEEAEGWRLVTLGE